MLRLLKNRKSGSAKMEFAIAAPVLLIMTLGAGDFARAFYHAISLANAAETGAMFGAQNVIYSGHLGEDGGMADAAKQDAKDLSAVTAMGERYCDCPGGAKVDCITGACVGYGPPRVYVSTRAEQTFKTAAPYPAVVPSSLLLKRTAFMRVQ